MRSFNADGSEAQMCGNGVRCVAEWLYTHGVAKETLVVDTNSGTKTITRKGRQLWQVEMGGNSAMAAALPAVNMGEGPLVDCPLTVEDRTWRVTCISVGNPHCVTVVDDVDSGETWACGTGTCATVAALTELGVCPAGEDVHVQLRGGELIIRVLSGKKLLMTGSAVTVCEGVTEV